MERTRMAGSPGLDRRTLLGSALGMATAAISAGAVRPASAQQTTKSIRFASLYPASHSASRTADKLAELIVARTSGRVRVDMFHNASLGGEREVAEGVRSGSIDAGYSGIPGFGTFAREVAILEMPYLYESLDELKSVVDKISPLIKRRMAESGVTVLGYLFDGPRVTLATKPLRSFADFRGLKLRVPQAPVYVQMAQAFGALPTPIALPEIYSAIQSRVADALEGTPTSIVANKYYEVAPNLIRTDHIFFVAYIAMNTALLNTLSPQDQAVVIQAGQECTEFNLQISKAAVEEDMKRLTDAKVTIINVDKAPFRQAVASMNESYAKTFAERGVEILQAIKSATGR